MNLGGELIAMIYCQRGLSVYAILGAETVTGTAVTPKTWGSYWDYFGLRLVELVGVTEGALVLDVGTGGGASLYPAARIVGDRGQVIGIETCHGCQERTSSEISRCGITNAKVLLMDAEDTTFADGSFDFVIAGLIGWDDCYDFGSCEFKKRDRRLEEILRVLKNGGRVGFTGWISQEDGDWMQELILRYLPADSLNEEGNRPRVPDAFSKETSKGWQRLLSSLGLKETRVSEETGEFTYRDEEEWWKEMLDAGWKNHVEKIEKAGLLDSLRSEATSLLQRHRDNMGIHFERSVVFALGTK
jgi:ubiquinone/menaquinone biosynthesis C-methylase UbiE